MVVSSSNERGIGYLFQKDHFFDKKHIIENIKKHSLGLKINFLSQKSTFMIAQDIRDGCCNKIN